MVKDKKPVDTSKKVKTEVKKTEKRPVAKIFTPFIKLGKYLKGSWVELHQVRWPNRKSTWGMTMAVLLFTGFFILIIVLLDAGFEALFNLIIK